MKFQQLTGPVMAKGLEDTSFYIYNRLVSLNEVGGEPDHFGVEPAGFHDWIGRAGALAAVDEQLLDARHQAERGRAGPDQRALRDPGRVGASG
jgi:maltooligosyltrehalose synthase